MSKLFIKHPCRYCGKPISNCGFAYTRHYEMHRRNGEVGKGGEVLKPIPQYGVDPNSVKANLISLTTVKMPSGLRYVKAVKK